ncbi:MAG: Mut7-C RNAse domain-containing protein [Proteobacteria bacterium]|nr:Mut7-C RNAse domain-containing protein [Pseudomonadota bacterium]
MPGTAPRFICDSMLGRLAKSLRMLGFDTLYARPLSPQALMQTAFDQQRIILSRRTVFSKSASALSSVSIRSNAPEEQLREVIAACDITGAVIRPFTICLRCNAPLADLAREAAAGRVPEYVLATVDHFATCPSCCRVYWKGSHYRNMAEGILKSIA